MVIPAGQPHPAAENAIDVGTSPQVEFAFFVVRLSLKRAGTLRHVRTCEILEKSAEGIDMEDRAYGLALWWPWPWPVVASTTATMPPIAAAPST